MGRHHIFCPSTVDLERIGRAVLRNVLSAIADGQLLPQTSLWPGLIFRQSILLRSCLLDRATQEPLIKVMFDQDSRSLSQSIAKCSKMYDVGSSQPKDVCGAGDRKL